MTRGIPFSHEPPSPKGFRSALFRQVSQDALAEQDVATLKFGGNDGRGSPARCVSEFDIVALSSRRAVADVNDSEECCSTPNTVPVFRTPLDQPGMFQHHVQSIRLEAELHPFRLIVSRLMSHPTLNKKGIFNMPVDPVALNLPDYLKVITKPMDLGSIRTRLHSLEFCSREAVVNDIRLVFENAMKYNPPKNVVHEAAKELLAFFEEQLHAFVPEICAGGFSSLYAASPINPVDPAISTQVDPLVTQNLTSSVRETDSGGKEFNTKKRLKRGEKKSHNHACQWCMGRSCFVCRQGCLHLEPCLLICNGPQCFGSRIRKGAIYYIAPDGSRQYCERCHIGLPAILPNGSSDETYRYKRDLLKRKNDEEVVEDWLTCRNCNSSIHKVCAMFNEYAQDDANFICGNCVSSPEIPSSSNKKRVALANEDLYSYICGTPHPIRTEELHGGHSKSTPWTADRLPESSISAFIQEKVRERLRSGDYPNADKTVFVRVISDCDKQFKVPDTVRNHFRVVTGTDDETQRPPSHVNYRSKAIALFQKIDGYDVCIFCMYAQEYPGSVHVNHLDALDSCTDKKRVYIAYLDSVEHFRPRQLRTTVYHEILVSYLATARARGFETAHIWACPPSRGNSFVFWAYPSSQRTPTKERLTTWYHEALLHALDRGVVLDVKSLYETAFEPFASQDDEDSEKFDNVCPPILDGDFWIEEAIRLHSINMSRCLKSRTVDGCITSGPCEWVDLDDVRCPALEMAAFIREQIIAHPVAFFFRKPVNAAALNLRDYHKIITRPMDLGTIYARCMLGEYFSLKHLVGDIELVVSNAKKFNPPGHVVHAKADELLDLFFEKLNTLVKGWPRDELPVSDWKAFQHVSLRLDGSFVSDNVSTASVVSGSVSSFVSTKGSSFSVAELLAGGTIAVEKRMVGDDTWLLEKKPPPSSGKGSGLQKKCPNRRRKSPNSSEAEPSAKRRRQTWLAEGVSSTIRRMRQSFFSCTLKGQGSSPVERENKFASFVEVFNENMSEVTLTPSNLADARHALLEFSQFRNLQFDTLRRAKYSTAVLLYHLHNPDAPGVTPVCSGCGVEVKEVRWHKVCKVTEVRRTPARAAPAHLHKRSSEPSLFNPEELCQACFASRTEQTDFIPIPVSFSP